ncbi:MAG: ankyrin repeat domain-containing protein [Alphaproteobacteria bacterium]|nr:ankyrin repeat domain-containing protein [Alphaproteobacteria bacterium]
MFGFGGPDTPEQRDKKLRKAAKRGDAAEITRLLDAGANIDNADGFWGNTALGWAADQGHIHCVRLLLERGARIDPVNALGWSPLVNAVVSNHGEIVDLLLEKGASITLKDGSGRTPLDNALNYKMKDMVERLNRHSMKLAAEREIQRQAREEKLRLLREESERRASQEYANVVVFKQRAGDLSLEDIFNFVSLERLTLVRKGEDGPVETMTRQNMADMDNRTMLKKALEEHARRGGKLTEKDIFPDEKPKLNARFKP